MTEGEENSTKGRLGRLVFASTVDNTPERVVWPTWQHLDETLGPNFCVAPAESLKICCKSGADGGNPAAVCESYQPFSLRLSNP